MNTKGIGVVAAVLLSGCVSNGGGEAVVAEPVQDQGGTVTKALIETCWKQAGIKGDLYRFITPEEAAGIQPGGVFSESQHVVFTACLNA
ncbi:50S ribosomal protein L20 [Pseudophaeobacter sp.]|uniref:50S ribosomal protein L20 n=1 Tax=Pseudophaeobacter sp. TaxID=1971739 RepID=UPI003297A3E7